MSPDPVEGLSFYVPKDPRLDCQAGLVCCIDTDQCVKMNGYMPSLVTMGMLGEGSKTECLTACADPAVQVSDNFACPDGETCCFTALPPG